MNNHICYCGHDCARCKVYRATIEDNDALRAESAAFYGEAMGRSFPIEAMNCHGGRSDNVMEGCKECPFMVCCKELGLEGCLDCTSPCVMFLEYHTTYVNKVNQV